MYCSKCGAELADDSVFCSKCGAKVGQAPVQGNPGMSQNNPETIIMEGLCNRVKSALFVENRSAILTNKRFVYLKHSLAKTMVIGALVNLTKGSYDFDIPLANILNIEDGRQGISKTIVINTKDGERYNFYVTKREEWKICIQSAIDALGAM